MKKFVTTQNFYLHCFISFIPLVIFPNEALVFSFFFFLIILIGLPHGSLIFLSSKKIMQASFLSFFIFYNFSHFFYSLGLTFLLSFHFIFITFHLSFWGDWTKKNFSKSSLWNLYHYPSLLFFLCEVNEIFQNLSTLDQIIHRDFLLGIFIFCFFIYSYQIKVTITS